MKRAKFEVFQGRSKLWYWRLKSANGRIVAASEGYTRKRDAERSQQAVWTAAHDAWSADLRELGAPGIPPASRSADSRRFTTH